MSSDVMSSRVWLGRLLRIGGALEAVVAVALLADPSGVASVLLQSTLEEPGRVVGRIGGGALVSLGIACWCARTTPSSPAGRGVAWALLAYNVVACVTLAWAGAAMASGGLLAMGAAVLHGLFGVALLGALVREGHVTQ
jgi:hypothetical protein